MTPLARDEATVRAALLTWCGEEHENLAALARIVGQARAAEELLADIRMTGFSDWGDCGATTCVHSGCLTTRRVDAALAGAGVTDNDPTLPCHICRGADGHALWCSAGVTDNERTAEPESCPHCGLPGKPYCWCGEHAPLREAGGRKESYSGGDV